MTAGLRSLAAGVLLAAPLLPAAAQRPAPFRVEETTIAEIHAAMGAGRLTCRALVERYLARIAANDKSGPAINSLVALNPEASGSRTRWMRALGRAARPDRCTASR